MKNFNRAACMGLICFSLAASGFADENESRIEVGSRSFTETEQIAIKNERSQRELQSKSEDLSQDEDNDQPRTTQSVAVAKGDEEAAENGQEQLLQKSKAAQKTTYYTTHEGALHRPIAVSVLGDTVELEDGSIWTVRGGDRSMTMNWLGSDSILILPNHKWFSSYDYVLVNQNTGATVQVNLTLGPIYNGIYTHWIVAIDYYNRKICLEDGSVWNISYFDEGILNNWLVNDTIIIGINDGWFSGNRPNILINVNMNNFVTGKCVY